MATAGAQLAICGVSATGRTARDLLACVLSFFTGELKAVRPVSWVAPQRLCPRRGMKTAWPGRPVTRPLF